MFKKYLLPIAAVAAALTMAPTYLERADASPFIPHALAEVAPASDVQPVYWRGGYYRGWRGGYYRGWRGGWRIGAPYYGGVWYGPGTALVRRSLVALWRRHVLEAGSHGLRLGMWLRTTSTKGRFPGGGFRLREKPQEKPPRN